MTTHEYLSRIERLRRMIQNKLSEIYQLKTMACSITVSNDGERVQTSPDKDRLGTTVAKIVDLENETNKLIDSFIAERSHIISQIDKINDTNMYTVLTARYVSGKTIEDIAKDMSYSRMQVDRIRNNALSEFEKMYGNEYLDKK